MPSSALSPNAARIELGHQFRRQTVGLVQVPQVRLGQRPAGVELGQHLAAAGEQASEPELLVAEYLAYRVAVLELAEPGQGLLDQRRRQVLQRPDAVGAPQQGEGTPQ